MTIIIRPKLLNRVLAVEWTKPSANQARMPIACAAIGVWYSLCFVQRYEAKLIGI